MKNEIELEEVCEKSKVNQLSNKKRIYYLDIARTFAIISVVLCHSVELIYNMNLKGWLNLGIKSQIYRTIVFTVGRLGVPIFLLISGYLLLNRRYDNDNDVKKFYKNNLISLILVTEIWIIIYNVFIVIYNNQNFDIYILIKEMFFVEKVPLRNMWYMPMIIGIYIAIPYLSKIVHTFSLKSLNIPIIMVFILTFILPTINIILKTFKLEQYGNLLDISFLGGIYGIYIVSGYFISNKIFKNIKTIRIVFMSIIFFIFSCVIQIFEYNNNVEYNIWYNSPLLYLCTLNLFELFTRINTEKMSNKIKKVVTYISKISLAIYFIHIIVEMILSKYIKLIGVSNSIRVLILFEISFIFTILIIRVLSKIKIIKTKVLLVKE